MCSCVCWLLKADLTTFCWTSQKHKELMVTWLFTLIIIFGGTWLSRVHSSHPSHIKEPPDLFSAGLRAMFLSGKSDVIFFQGKEIIWVSPEEAQCSRSLPRTPERLLPQAPSLPPISMKLTLILCLSSQEAVGNLGPLLSPLWHTPSWIAEGMSHWWNMEDVRTAVLIIKTRNTAVFPFLWLLQVLVTGLWLLAEPSSTARICGVTGKRSSQHRSQWGMQIAPSPFYHLMYNWLKASPSMERFL